MNVEMCQKFEGEMANWTWCETACVTLLLVATFTCNLEVLGLKVAFAACLLGSLLFARDAVESCGCRTWLCFGDVT